MSIEFVHYIKANGIYIEFGINSCRIVSDPFHDNDLHITFTITKLNGLEITDIVNKINANYHKIPILILNGKIDYHTFENILNEFNTN